MIHSYARMAQTLSDLEYEPFPSVMAALPELADAASRLPTRLPNPTGSADEVDAEGTAAKPLNSQRCEGGDLNPYANYGASTSS